MLISGKNCDCSVIFEDFVETLKILLLWAINEKLVKLSELGVI